jgi:hypothetical protein
MPFNRHPRAWHNNWLRVALALIFSAGTAAVLADEPAPDAKPQAPATPPGFEATLTDGSALKIKLREERIEFQTRYGKLLIPAADLKRIDFRSRTSAEVARKAEAAVSALASKEFRVRESASAELTRLGERAYPALLRAAGESDAEVAHRAKELLDKLREAVPAERLEIHEDDTVWAGGSQIVGRIAAESLRIETLPFGEQSLRLADVRSLRSPDFAEDKIAANAAPDPGSLATYQGQQGKTLTFLVTGRAAGAMGAGVMGPGGMGPGGMVPGPFPGGMGGMRFAMAADAVWGTGTYTLDSTLAAAAVHAGVLRAGQTGVVKVKLLAPQASFEGSTRNGVTSMAFGFYPGAFSLSR